MLDLYERATWAAISERYKLIAYSDGTEELYDLLEDPGEQHPIDASTRASTWAPASPDHRVLEALRASVNESRAMQQLSAGAEPNFDAETLEALRALGYLK